MYRAGGLPRCAQIATDSKYSVPLVQHYFPGFRNAIVVARIEYRRTSAGGRGINIVSQVNRSVQYAAVRIRAQSGLLPRLQDSLTHHTIPGGTKLVSGLLTRCRRSRQPPLKVTKAAKPPRLPTGPRAPSATTSTSSSVLRMHFGDTDGSHVGGDAEATSPPNRGTVAKCCWSACTGGGRRGGAVVASTTSSCCRGLRTCLMSPKIPDPKHVRWWSRSTCYVPSLNYQYGVLRRAWVRFRGCPQSGPKRVELYEDCSSVPSLPILSANWTAVHCSRQSERLKI